jgi:hypothetical protein
MQICNTDVEYYINLGLLLYMYRKKYEKRLSDPPLFQGSFHPWLQMRASIALLASLIQSPAFQIDADPYPGSAFHFNANQDPAPQNDADPDPNPLR